MGPKEKKVIRETHDKVFPIVEYGVLDAPLFMDTSMKFFGPVSDGEPRYWAVGIRTGFGWTKCLSRYRCCAQVSLFLGSPTNGNEGS